MKFLEKLQKLNPEKKKLILWSVAAILGICFLFLWIKLTEWRLSGVTKGDLLQGIPMPNITIPKLEIPMIPSDISTSSFELN